MLNLISTKRILNHTDNNDFILVYLPWCVPHTASTATHYARDGMHTSPEITGEIICILEIYGTSVTAFLQAPPRGEYEF